MRYSKYRMQVDLSKQINAPIERVFDVFTDLPSAADRLSGVESVEVLTDGPFAIGTRWKETRVMMGKAATETMWITAVEPNRSYTAEAESCGTHYTSTFTFEPVDGGTRVTMSFSGRPVRLWAWLMVPVGVLMTGPIKKMVVQDLDDLAVACEKPD
ncbi:MAG: SRPBCC family protein [Planctomycetota bacterium]